MAHWRLPARQSSGTSPLLLLFLEYLNLTFHPVEFYSFESQLKYQFPRKTFHNPHVLNKFMLHRLNDVLEGVTMLFGMPEPHIRVLVWDLDPLLQTTIPVNASWGAIDHKSCDWTLAIHTWRLTLNSQILALSDSTLAIEGTCRFNQEMGEPTITLPLLSLVLLQVDRDKHSLNLYVPHYSLSSTYLFWLKLFLIIYVFIYLLV